MNPTARRLKAENLLNDLAGRGFFLMNLQGELLIVPLTGLLPADTALLGELWSEVAAALADGWEPIIAFKDLNVEAWYATVPQFVKMAFLYYVRMPELAGRNRADVELTVATWLANEMKTRKDLPWLINQ